MHLRHLPIILASFAFAACVGTLDSGLENGGGSDTGGGGGGGGGGGEDVGTPDAGVTITNYEMTVDPALGEINLGDQVSFTAAISSENFTGPVTLDLVGALDSWDVVYTPSQTVNLLPNEITNVVVSVVVPTNAEAGGSALTFALSGELGTRQGNAQVNVANQILFDIPNGTGTGDHGFSGALQVRSGVSLVFTNSDTMGHRIHSDPHGVEFGPGGSDTIVVTSSTTEAYCHDHAGGSGKIDILVQ